MSRDDAVELLAIDALTYRIITIGDAVNDRSAAARDAHSEVPWWRITRMRDLLTHRYHRRGIGIIRATVDRDLEALRRACDAIVAGRHPSG